LECKPLGLPHHRRANLKVCTPFCRGVVVGLDNQNVYVHDPAFNHAPIQVPLPQFELAWMTLDYRYGVIIKNDTQAQMTTDK